MVAGCVKLRIVHSSRKNAIRTSTGTEATHGTTDQIAFRCRRRRRKHDLFRSSFHRMCQSFHFSSIRGRAARFLKFVVVIVSIPFLLAFSASAVMSILAVEGANLVRRHRMRLFQSQFGGAGTRQTLLQHARHWISGNARAIRSPQMPQDLERRKDRATRGREWEPP